ncbi:MAG: hypothetical protein WBZ11_11955, partial [Candidatus Sulfotelmatobacter sp.]
GWNQYAYATNPLISVDPSGLACYPLEKQVFGTCAGFLDNGVSFGGSWDEFWTESSSTLVGFTNHVGITYIDPNSGAVIVMPLGATAVYETSTYFVGSVSQGSVFQTSGAANNGWITAATDAAGIAGLFLKGKVAKLLGPATAAVSIRNDPRPQNTITNLLGLFEGFEGPMAITGAFNDFLDWGANNSTPGPQTVYGSGTSLQTTLPTQDLCAAFGTGPC